MTTFPFKVRRDSVTTRVYRVRRADGREVYFAAWHVAGRRLMRQFGDFSAALAEATTRAKQLAKGRLNDAAQLNQTEADTFREALKLCGETSLLQVVDQWRRAQALTDGKLLDAAKEYQTRHNPSALKIKVPAAVDAFIAAKESAGHAGENTYRAKLKQFSADFSERYLHDLGPTELETYLQSFSDGCTRNDYRGRVITLFRWAQVKGYIPYGAPLAITRTLRAKATHNPIGIINAATFARLLVYFQEHHKGHLPALVLASMCGLRADEIQGKRTDRTRRQKWDDVHFDRGFVRVSVAKENTPGNRYAPLCPAALEWLRLTPIRSGPVSAPLAIKQIRQIAADAGFSLPPNCFRHSFISHRIAVTNNPPQVALEAGNSVAMIHRHYRVPLTEDEGKAWFGITPANVAQVAASAAA